jgi:hypothetical protein
LDKAGKQVLVTQRGHGFVAIATFATRKATSKPERVIRIMSGVQEYARIYPCCWGHTTNCHGTRIGGYSDALDRWVRVERDEGLESPDKQELSPAGKKQRLSRYKKVDVDHSFKRLVNQLPSLLESLDKSPLRPWHNLGILPSKGIYVFYENRRPIYVGRTNLLKNRIAEHGRPSSMHNSAPFAFNLARASGREKGIDLKMSRSKLEQSPAFATLFSEAKERVTKMLVQVIEVDDPVIQTLFEVYASLALKTTEYNDFDTH